MAPLFCEPSSGCGEDLAVDVRTSCVTGTGTIRFSFSRAQIQPLTVPGDDVAEGLGLDLWAWSCCFGRSAPGRVRQIDFNARTLSQTSQAVGFGSYRLLDGLLLTTGGFLRQYLITRPMSFVGLPFIDLKDTTRLDP